MTTNNFANLPKHILTHCGSNHLAALAVGAFVVVAAAGVVAIVVVLLGMSIALA